MQTLLENWALAPTSKMLNRHPSIKIYAINPSLKAIKFQNQSSFAKLSKRKHKLRNPVSIQVVTVATSHQTLLVSLTKTLDPAPTRSN
jgi:hypothetical protein